MQRRLSWLNFKKEPHMPAVAIRHFWGGGVLKTILAVPLNIDQILYEHITHGQKGKVHKKKVKKTNKC